MGDPYAGAWRKLRRKVRAEQRRYQPTGDGSDLKLSKDDRVIAAAMESAYGSVLRMMDALKP
jgi:hypothetical protein